MEFLLGLAIGVVIGVVATAIGGLIFAAIKFSNIWG